VSWTSTGGNTSWELEMRIESRTTFGKKSVILIPENEEESQIIDNYLGAEIPTQIEGEVDLSDGYGEHYIRLRKKGV
jgi:hypothetical protein